MKIFWIFYTGQNGEYTPPRLSFDEILAAHRSNRLNETFGQINISDEFQSKREKEINSETLLPLRYKPTLNPGNSRIYFSNKNSFVFNFR